MKGLVVFYNVVASVIELFVYKGEVNTFVDILAVVYILLSIFWLALWPISFAIVHEILSNITKNPRAQPLKGLFHPAFLARVVSWFPFVVAIFMGHENGGKQRLAKRRHVQGMLDETDPLTVLF